MKKFNYKKAFYITLIVTLVIVLLFSSFIYLNIDYLVFKLFITRDYLSTKTLDNAFTQELGIDINNKYYKYFDNLAIEELSKLLAQVGNDPYTYQYTPKEYNDYVIWRETKAAKAFVKEITPSAIYMLYPNFTVDSYNFLLSNIDTINKYDTLIIDLQGDGGGDLDVLFDMCGIFVGNKDTIAIEKTRHSNKKIKSTVKKQLNPTNIIILIDEHSASASESFTITLKELLPNVTIVGTTSYGKGIGQARINLTKGFYAKATTLEWLSPSGISINKVGIVPDIYYSDDNILDYVINNII